MFGQRMNVGNGKHSNIHKVMDYSRGMYIIEGDMRDNIHETGTFKR